MMLSFECSRSGVDTDRKRRRSSSPFDSWSRPPRLTALIESAQHRWRAVNSAHLVALVRAGAKFENGVLVERPDESTSGDTHAA